MITMKFIWMKLSVLFILIGATCSLNAQMFTGRVTDPTGAVLPKVTVIAHNIDTGVDIKATTNGTGAYTIPYLHAGNFSVSAVAKGFQQDIRDGITLQVGQTSVVDFKLQVGSETMTVTVTANTLLDAGKADQGEVVENARVSELPLNGRDPILLATLVAGINNTNSFGYQRPFDDNAGSLSANGGGNGNIEMLLDGTPNNISPINVTGGSTEGIAKTAYTTPVDSVQEFKVVTGPYDAQYGLMAGGVEDMILKSGTNRVHGDVYEYARRTFLDANTWSNDWAQATAKPGTDLTQFKKPVSNWNQYGFELDGPVVIPKIYNGKNKSFFTMQVEHFHALSPLTDVASVPDPAWANGDFSNLDYWNGTGYVPMQIFDPLTSVQDTDPTHKNTYLGYVRNQFPGNQINQNRFDPMAQKILKMFPAPNVTVTGGRNHTSQNYVLSTSGVDTYNNILLKWDENLSSKDRFTVRYGYWMRNTTYNGNGMPPPLSTGSVPIVARSHTFATEETHTFTPNVLLDFRANVSVRDDIQRGGSAFDPTAFWSPDHVASMGPAASSEFPLTQLSGYTTVGSTGNTNAIKNSLNLLPTLTWIKHAHTLRIGLDARFWQNGYKTLVGGPTIAANSGWTQYTANHSYNIPTDGSTVASYLMGYMSSATNQIWPKTYQSQHYWAPFLQDDLKVTRKLTLNLGLRWDLMPAETERHDKGNYAFDTVSVNPYLAGVNLAAYGHGSLTGGVTFVGQNGNPRSSYKTVMSNFQPRVGFAYALNDKTVIRGGFGKSMRTAANGIPVNGFSAGTTGLTSDPNYLSGVFPNQQNNLENLFWGGPNGAVLQPTATSLGLGTNLGQGINFVNPHYKTPSFWSYSLGFERQLGRNSSINVSYVGSRLYGGDSTGNINMQKQSLRVACDPENGGDRHNCDGTLNSVPNPFIGVNGFQGSGNYTQKTMNTLDLWRPFPADGNINMTQQNDARSWYNSLQITAMHRVSRSLTLHGTETWSKMMDAGTWADQSYGIRNRTIDGQDMPQRITVSGVYMLPVGRGHMFLPHVNRIVDTAIGGWELSSMFIMQSGTPQGVPGYYLHNAKVNRHIQANNGYIRVFAPGAEHYVQTGPTTYGVQQYAGTVNNGVPFAYSYDGPTTGTPNFMDVPYDAPGAMTEFSGIRTAGMRQFDTSFAKNFKIYEDLRLQLRLDAFNVLNHPEWLQGADTGTSFDANLGVITKGPTGPSNNPRRMQLSAKITW